MRSDNSKDQAYDLHHFHYCKLISDTWCTVDSSIVMLEETTHQNRKVVRTLLQVDANHASKMFVYPYSNQVCSTLLVQAVHALTAYKEHEDDSSDRASFLSTYL